MRVLEDQAKLTSFKGRDIVIDAEILSGELETTSQQLRAGALTRGRLSRLRFQIDEFELLAGRILSVERTKKEKNEALAFLETLPTSGGQSGHCALLWEELWEIGLGGLKEKTAKLAENSEGERAEAYHSFNDALAGVFAMIDNACDSVEVALATAKPHRKTELNIILDSCRWVASKAPRDFRDAIQLSWFVMMGTMIGDAISYVCPGMLDRHFARFINDGTKFENEALRLLEAYYFLINDFIPAGGAYAIMVGGVDENGRNVTNKLSFLCLEALRRTNLVYPTVGVCWHENTPEALTNLAVELISEGYSTPAFFGDATIRKGLMRYGIPEKEACDYQNSTCVEITPYGSSNVWVASPYFSLCGILMDALAEMVEDENGETKTYDGFLSAYYAKLADEIAEAAEIQNQSRERRRENNRNPLQSIFTRDCLERGCDIDAGGARYNWVECSFVGLANLVDSLKVLKEEVFNSGNFTLLEMKQLLDANFAENENLRIKFLNAHSKYGLNDAEVDSEVRKFVKFVSAECAKHKMSPDDSHFIPGTFCWVMHQRLGAECGATPDGRKAAAPFADGAGPAQGREKLGPTAAINSVTSWDHSSLIGGSAFNMKFDSSVFSSSESKEKLKQLVLVFLRQGGFETQINVLRHGILKKAKADPEAYRDLVVRIGGYTDYFTKLSPQMQDEVMMRTEYTEL
jgi:formate C-acetyltransferase